MRVRYSGPVRDAYVLVGELNEAGFEVGFTPPEEQRSGEPQIVEVLIRVPDEAKAGAVVGSAAVGVVERIARTFIDQHPGVVVLVEPGEPH